MEMFLMSQIMCIMISQQMGREGGSPHLNKRKPALVISKHNRKNYDNLIKG